MIELALILSLQITAIYVCFQEGMLLGWLRIFLANWLDKYLGSKISRYVQKPIWDCLPCMASVWTLLLALRYIREPDIIMALILIVCGINVLIDKILDYE
jgi:hypothetical protein